MDAGSQMNLHITPDQDGDLLDRKWKDRKLRVKLVPDPPDGGYGWVVVFASMMLLLLCHR